MISKKLEKWCSSVGVNTKVSIPVTKEEEKEVLDLYNNSNKIKDGYHITKKVDKKQLIKDQTKIEEYKIVAKENPNNLPEDIIYENDNYTQRFYQKVYKTVVEKYDYLSDEELQVSLKIKELEKASQANASLKRIADIMYFFKIVCLIALVCSLLLMMISLLR